MSSSQNDWYQQRYGSAQVNKRQRQLYAARTAHYEEIKELHQEKRQTYQENAVSVFAEHGINYEVRGHSWLCQVGTQSLYFWPKSGKWRVQGRRKTYYSRGAQDFLNKAFSYQERQKQWQSS
jgi:hypothetical protein